MAKARVINGLDPQAAAGQNARIIAAERLDEMYSWDRYVDEPHSVLELHNLRIASKRLRYTLEIFENVLPEACKPLLKEVEQVQEELGSLHDSDVLIAELRLCLGQPEALFPQPAGKQKEAQRKVRPLVNPDLVTVLLEPSVAPSEEEEQGLEGLLQAQVQVRDRRYTAFRQHWYRLQARDFRSELLGLLNL